MDAPNPPPQNLVEGLDWNAVAKEPPRKIKKTSAVLEERMFNGVVIQVIHCNQDAEYLRGRKVRPWP